MAKDVSKLTKLRRSYQKFKLKFSNTIYNLFAKNKIHYIFNNNNLVIGFYKIPAVQSPPGTQGTQGTRDNRVHIDLYLFLEKNYITITDIKTSIRSDETDINTNEYSVFKLNYSITSKNKTRKKTIKELKKKLESKRLIKLLGNGGTKDNYNIKNYLINNSFYFIPDRYNVLLVRYNKIFFTYVGLDTGLLDTFSIYQDHQETTELLAIKQLNIILSKIDSSWDNESEDERVQALRKHILIDSKNKITGEIILPSSITMYTNTSKYILLEWFKNGYLHRINKPAKILLETDSSVELTYSVMDNYHNLNGPSIIRYTKDLKLDIINYRNYQNSKILFYIDNEVIPYDSKKIDKQNNYKKLKINFSKQ
jgi:hypothetical protein